MKLKKSLIALTATTAVLFSSVVAPVQAQEIATTTETTAVETSADEVDSVETVSDKTPAESTTTSEKPSGSKKESSGSSTSNVLDTIRGIFGYKKSDEDASDSDKSEDKPESQTDTILSWIKLVSVVITTLTGLVTLISKFGGLK
ncbi:hypothetical protein CMUST_08715 [Corynebacterium mustelae]|uniref:Secreted protein n=1 Tax=Corynebacterium mustelae TaxID=571915 RepID=A0A0G3H4K4_9CORY|nr:hypothetical protein [Corynebacterium mustelae]AKK06067.1 hypothetical protein CMUST_08715 [Corynebacterium mustelae]